MKSFAALAFAATALAQTPPSGCVASAPGTFQISTVNVTSDIPNSKRSLATRQLSGVLTLSLEDGDLTDQAGRTGYIASNAQFQFDAPIQPNARESTGFSLCSNGTLALDSSAIWYQCLSGDFYNLYSESLGGQCVPIYIQAVMTDDSGASQISDGQPQVTQPPVVSQISDGQPQASTPVISQISDGQPQVTFTPPVVSQISDGQPQATFSPPVVSQISDGQPQVTFTPIGNITAPINATMSAPAEYTGAAAAGNAPMGALFAGLLGLLAML